jgi:cytochrome P450
MVRPFRSPKLTVVGEYWKHSRASSKPNFVRSRLNTEIIEPHVQNLVGCFKKKGVVEVDLQKLVFRMTLDMITGFLFEESTNTLLQPQSRIDEAFGCAERILGIRIRMGPFVTFHYNRKFKEECKYIHDFVSKRVDHSLQRAGEDNFVQNLAKDFPDRNQLCSQLVQLILAGRDTTAAFISSTFFLLARAPDDWNKLQAEIAHLPSLPSADDLKELEYLRAVLNESLRLHPPVPMNIRYTRKDTTLPVGNDGERIFVAKDTVIVYSVHAMHRDVDIYGPDAHEFKPERWENIRPSWSFLPFNGGPRLCLGQQLALLEASYTVVRMLQMFENIGCLDPRPWKEILTKSQVSANGVNVLLTPRESLLA